MRLFYCNDVVSHIANTSANISIFRHDGHNLSLKNHQNTHLLLSVDCSNTSILTTTPNQVIHYSYSAFGFNSPSNNEWGFKGEWKDPISNGYLLGNGRRLYCPSTLRFVSPDPLSPFSSGGLNHYAFALNDPINNSDPTGLSALSMIFKPLKYLSKLMNPRKTYHGKVVWQHRGMTAFTGKPRTDGNLETLYISSHGQPGSLVAGTYAYRAADIYKKLEQQGIEMQGRQTHILSCFSAMPAYRGGFSFADDMAKLTGAQSSGYADIIAVEDKIGNHGTIASHRLLPSIMNFWAVPDITKVRRGNIRNPHKTQGAGSGGKYS
ncbi:RHS repeat-associated core domain-containing protein [Pseudomonas fulva]|uniref:RHS repeat-associated core domain-containing protein n=1 Tax=Pseudomonas TaxID=286 RepID=UPI0018AB1C26|nr:MULTISPECIES: RHS repeat-associated core domain-containing protein [Pseudomonas]MBF8635789.1 RHS repeat-associated core domain-containing protein [Pseudomonas fulva]MBF8687842.1 RHS repeat-associated core domain-containing protein [Pseudomonas fulva]MBH3345829.1 RHS repeat-associated core domain-containing protein [Pseudomonas parafulva]